MLDFPNSCNWPLFILLENIRKSEVFWCFQGELNETGEMKWVSPFSIERSSHRSPATFLKHTMAQVFSCGFCEIFKNTFFKENLQTNTSTLIHARSILPSFWNTSIGFHFIKWDAGLNALAFGVDLKVTQF